MRVLYVTASCLTRNTSANLSHNAFVQGLLENGCDLDILMAKDSWGEPDRGLPHWEQACYHTFQSVSAADRLRSIFRSIENGDIHNSGGSSKKVQAEVRFALKPLAKTVARNLFYSLFPRDPLYPLEKKWLKTASHYRSKEKYDLVISNSSPAASHKLVEQLLAKGRISTDRWIQIWEDPWYHDLYGGHTVLEEQEEHRLLQSANEIVYVSPLTLMYQKRFFPDCEAKMRCVVLPSFQINESEVNTSGPDQVSFGYFGDYYSATRDLTPFYEALCISGYKGFIYGDSDIRLSSTNEIEVSERVTLDKLGQIQNQTSCLVHLSNLRGGQIPGKLYHYSATNKPILFILDGTEEEKKTLLDFFAPYGRYSFCENDSKQILKQLQLLAKKTECMPPVMDFFPVNVVKKLIDRKV